MPITLSRPPCTFRYMGVVMIMMPNTTRESSGMAATNTRADFTSMVKAMIMAPNTINGERRNRRSTMFTPFCT